MMEGDLVYVVYFNKFTHNLTIHKLNIKNGYSDTWMPSFNLWKMQKRSSYFAN